MVWWEMERMRGRGGEGKEVKRSKLTGAQRERDGSLSSYLVVARPSKGLGLFAMGALT